MKTTKLIKNKMKKKRLLKTVLAALVALTVGVVHVSAFSTNDLVAQGWTKVTSLSDVSNYYYVLVDAGSSNYAMGRLASSTDRPVYMNLADPLGFAGEVWALSGSGPYTMQSLIDNRYFISGDAGWNDSMADASGTQGNFNFSLSNGVYSITSVTTNQLVGPWNNDNAVSGNYENIAANKGNNQAPGFYVYAMSRTDYNAKRINDSWLTSHGWSKVTANSSLGNTDNYYLIIEKESFGYALARTSNGRPAHKSLSNPFTAPCELWLLSASGSGYKFQSAVDNTYFSSAAGDWNTSMGNHNADIIATISDGVYTLSAGGTSNIGHWQDNTQFPFENENVAANKNETNRNSYYIYTISKANYATQRASNISSLASNATEASPANLTSFVINNSDFSVLAKQGWTVSGTWGNQQIGNGAFETWNSTNVSVTQDVADLPGGLYTFQAQIVMGNNSTTANIYANADEEYTANPSQVATDASYDGMKNEILADPAYAQVSVNPHMTSDGTMTVGLKVPSGWIVFDNFQLLYQGPTIKSSATAFTSGTAVTAGQWYSFDVAVAGDYAFTTTVALSNISYTTEGLTLIENVGSLSMSTPSATTALSVGTIYFKATSAATITIAPQSYTYTVGSATVNYEYVQGGETVTVTYADAVTNNTSASLSISTTGVQFNGSTPADLTATANGFTFTVPSGLSAATDYTLAIPAGIVGYAAGSTYNEAQNITFKTPAVFDGTYYLKVAATTTDLTTNSTSTGTVGKYLARGAAWGTHATVDNYGLPVIISTNKYNLSTIKAYDTQRYYYVAYTNDNKYDTWADAANTGDNTNFVFGTNQGHLTISSSRTPDVYFKHNDSEASNAVASVYYDGNGSNSGPIILWDLVSATDHATSMTSRKGAQAAAAATAANTDDGDTYAALASVTTVDAMETAVASMYSKVVVGGDAPTSVSEIYENRDNGSQSSGFPKEVYTGTITIPAAGLYRFSMQAFYRSASNAVTQDMHTNNVDFPPVVLFLGDAETQIKSLYDEEGGATAYVSGNDAEYNGQFYANDTDGALAMFQEGKYTNDVWAYFDAAGDYSYGVKYIGFANTSMQWFIYSPEAVTVTYYGSDDSRFYKLNAEIAKAQAINAVWNNSALASEITTAQAMYTAYSANLSDVNAEIAALKAKYPTSVAVSNGNFDTDPVYLADGTKASGATQVVSTNGDLYNVTGYSATGSGNEWVYGFNAEYGSSATLNNVTPPATDIYGEASGAALGLSAGWSHNTVYSQDVTFTNSGRYLIYYEAFNKHTAESISGNKVGLDGTYSSKVSGFTANAWVRDVFTVDIYESGSYPLTVGIYGEGSSGNNAKLWVDNVEIYRIGDAVGSINTAGGIVTVLGGNDLSDINTALTNTVSVVNLEKATGLSSAAISTTNNPNLLIYAKSASQVSNTKNVIANGTCSSLELQKSTTAFIVPTAFTATNAKYTVASAELAGGSFATLMIPFEASTLAGTAYALDQDINLIDGNIRGTSVSTIAANSPVLVTADGDYSGSNVTVPAVAAGATYTNGELVGTYTAISAPTSSYVLQNHTSGEGVAFYLVGNTTKPTMNPFRAYIKPQANNVRALQFLFDYDTDGINGIEKKRHGENENSVYDLSGRKMQNRKLPKGIYIVNGKRVIIK